MVANAIVAFDGDPVIQKSLFAPNPIALCRKTVMQTMRAYRAGKAGQRLEDSRRAGLRLLGRPATAVTLGDMRSQRGHRGVIEQRGFAQGDA